MSRNLDAAIAEALGNEVITEVKDGLSIIVGVGINNSWRPMKTTEYYTYECDSKGQWKVTLPRYSADGNAMLRLDKEMRKRHWYLSICSMGALNVAYFMKAWVDDEGEHSKKVSSERCKEIPEAVALAAYEALTGREYQDGNN